MKVIGANFAKKVEINNTGKNIVLGYTDKSGKFRVIRVDKDLEVWERITEENKFKFGPSMGWGFLGAVILGPIGAIAGILLKGRAKQCTVACVFTESRRCAIEMSPEEFTTFQFAAPAGSDVESIRAEAAKLVEIAEAEEAAENLYKKSLSLLNLADRPEYKDTANRDSYIKQAQEFEEIANRILKTYNGAI